MDLPIHFFKLPSIVLSVVAFVGCGISPNMTSSLESDELYLSSGEEFITDTEYLAFALNDLESLDSDEDYYNPSGYGSRRYSNNGYNSNQPYHSLGLSSHFSPYGYGFNNGFNNGYGYNNYNSGYNNYGYNSYGNGGYGYDPYNNSNGYGYNPFNNYGYGGYNSGGYFGNYTGTISNIMGSVFAPCPRTPLLTSTLTNSNYSGGRLSTNKTQETGSGVTNSTNVSSENAEVKKTRSIWNWETVSPPSNNNSTRTRNSNIPTSNSSARPSSRPDNNRINSNKTGRSNNSTGKSGGRRH